MNPLAETGRQPPAYLAVGRVVRPHGVRGALLVEGYSEIIHSLKPSTTIFLGANHSGARLRSFRPHGNQFLLSIEDCKDRTSAERWRGCVISISFADAAPLPEHEYYHWQILDLEVWSEEGQELGRVKQILVTGANDVYVIEDAQGKELLLPAIESVIRSVDLANGRIIVHLLPGLIP